MKFCLECYTSWRWVGSGAFLCPNCGNLDAEDRADTGNPGIAWSSDYERVREPVSICSAHIEVVPGCPRCEARPQDLLPDWNEKMKEKSLGQRDCQVCGFRYYRTISFCPKCNHPISDDPPFRLPDWPQANPDVFYVRFTRDEYQRVKSSFEYPEVLSKRLDDLIVRYGVLSQQEVSDEILELLYPEEPEVPEVPEVPEIPEEPEEPGAQGA